MIPLCLVTGFLGSGKTTFLRRLIERLPGQRIVYLVNEFSPLDVDGHVLAHDTDRLASRYGGQAQARVAAMMLLTLRGTPTLYYGDELGMENGVIPPDKIQDPQGWNLGSERTRDVCRTPMQWDGSTNAGFCPADVEPWLPVSADYERRNVAAQSADPSSILNLYWRLLQYRRSSTALQGGGYRAVETNDDCFVYLRQAGAERRLIALNFAGETRQISIPGETRGQVVLSTYLDREGDESLAALQLRAHEGVIVEL